jgi:hypothetical protein
MVLFYRSADDAGNSDAVAAHFHDLRLPAFVEESTFECFCVLGTELEDMPDFNTAAQLKLTLAVGRWITGDHIPQVGNDSRFRKVAAEVYAAQVKAGFVGAAYKIAHRCHAAVGKNSDAGSSNWTDIAWFAAKCGDDFVVASKAEFSNDFLRFYFRS